MDTTTALLITGAVAAGFVQGLTGFGFAMVSSAFWVWVLPPQLVAVLAVFASLIGQVLTAVATRRALDLPRLLPLVLGGLAGLPLGVWLLPRFDAALFQFFVGSLLALWCPLMLLSSRLPNFSKASPWADAAVGATGGVAGALGGFTGALPTLWCSLRGWDKDMLRAVIQNFNLTLLACTFATYLASGFVTRAMLPQMALVAPALLLPVLLGNRVYTGISPETFKRVVLLLLACTGAALLVKSLPVLLLRWS